MNKIKIKNKIITAITASCVFAFSGAILLSRTNSHKTVANTAQAQQAATDAQAQQAATDAQARQAAKNLAIFLTEDGDKLKTFSIINVNTKLHKLNNNSKDLDIANNTALKDIQSQNTEQLKKDLKNIFDQKGDKEAVKFLNENYKTNISNHISIENSQLPKIVEAIGKEHINQNKAVVLKLPNKNNPSDPKADQQDQQIMDLAKNVVEKIIAEKKDSNPNMDIHVDVQDFCKILEKYLKK